MKDCHAPFSPNYVRLKNVRSHVITAGCFLSASVVEFNRPFPSFLVPLFRSESKCETILMKMTLICMKIKLRAELIFI